MAAQGNATSAFDLSTVTSNGFFDSADLGDLMVVGGCGDSNNAALICDNNNNELAKHHSDPDTPTSTSSGELDQGQLLLHLTSAVASVKDRAAGDQSVDSGVAGGDSDEADCCNAPSLRNGVGGGGDLKEFPALLMNSMDMILETPVSYTNGLLEASEEDNERNQSYDQDCKICQNKLQSPRVLSCLHVFCELCLDRLLLNDLVGDGKFSSALSCPVCEQQTAVGPKGASSLHMDYMLTNILDLSSIDLEVLACTSCKGKEVAISRCNDCANILCASCDNAHQYMRCFENHKVIKLQDLLQSPEKVAIHKPLFCTVHPTENLKYYCQPCQVPVCNECLIIDHKGAEHSYEVIGDAEQVVRVELERQATEAEGKVDYCNEATQTLDNALTELQSQHDSARALIEESYQSFKAVLERCRDEALKELDSLHSERELKIMEVMHDVEKSTEKFENAHKFTGRVLASCNGPELLSLKRLICLQFSHLVNHIPKTDVNYSIEFESNFDNFKRMAEETFGSFRTEASAPSPKESTPPPTLPGLPPILINHHNNHHGQREPNGILGGENNRSMINGQNNSLMGISAFNGTTTTLGSQGTLTNSVTASSPISLPPSLQSSFDGDMSALSGGTQAPSSASTTGSMPSFGLIDSLNSQGNNQVVSPLQPPPMGPAGLSSIAEYNIQQLANLVEQSSGPTGQDMTDSIIPTNTSVPPPNTQGQITLADILSGDPHALQAWSKMGGLNQQASALLSRGPSPSVDNLLLNDFSAIAPNSDDLILNFNGNGSNQSASTVGVPGRTKSTPMQIRCKFGSLGPSKGQFNSPHGFCLGVDEEIIVADTNNHRIEVFEKTGTFKFQFGVPGKDEGQLWYPRKVAVMRPSSKFVVCDRGNERSRMQIFNKAGHFMKKIAIRYIDIVAGLAVTNQGHIVAVDSVSPTVFIISEEGNLIHWFDCSDYMREPSDIAINGNDFYVCDFKGHCVAVFSDEGKFKYRIGNEKITCFPNGIDISDAGDILIGDSHGNRFHVACFSREGVLQSEYECPYVKVSRCCGLKITSEGFVVTLAKNNHHVLVLNTLYIQ